MKRYGAWIIDWTDEELKALDRNTRKKLTMYGALHPKSDVHRLYLTRKNRGRRLIGIEKCIKRERNNLVLQVSGRQNETARQIVRERVKGVKDESSLRKENEENHQRQWHEKALHGRFITAVQDDMDKEKKLGVVPLCEVKERNGKHNICSKREGNRNQFNKTFSI